MGEPEEVPEVEIGHGDRFGDLSTPPDDDQVEPGAEPYEEPDDAEPGSS